MRLAPGEYEPDEASFRDLIESGWGRLLADGCLLLRRLCDGPAALRCRAEARHSIRLPQLAHVVGGHRRGQARRLLEEKVVERVTYPLHSNHGRVPDQPMMYPVPGSWRTNLDRALRGIRDGSLIMPDVFLQSGIGVKVDRVDLPPSNVRHTITDRAEQDTLARLGRGIVFGLHN